MRQSLERGVRRLVNRFGYDVLKVGRVACPRLPKPSTELVQRVADAFTDQFALAPDLALSDEEIGTSLGLYEWFYHFVFGTHEVGPNPGMPREQRGHFQRYMHLFPALLSQTNGTLGGMRVLDVGCNAGFWSIAARRLGAESVLGIDAGDRNIQQANLVAKLSGLQGVRYAVRNVYEMDAENTGVFDVVLFPGVLYHLDKPVLAIERLAAVTGHLLVVDTALLNSGSPMLMLDDDRAGRYHAQSHGNPLACVPSESAVVFMLRSAGFREVFFIPPRTRDLPPHYLSGRWGSFIALK